MPVVNPIIQKTCSLNQDAEAHNPSTNAMTVIMGDDEGHDDNKNNQQSRGNSEVGSNECMDWGKAMVSVPNDKNTKKTKSR